MKKRTFQFHDAKTGAAIAVRLQNGTSSAISAVDADGTIMIRLAPQKQDANEALLAYLAQVLGVAHSQIELVAGAQGSEKLITILGLSGDEVDARIRAQVRG